MNDFVIEQVRGRPSMVVTGPWSSAIEAVLLEKLASGEAEALVLNTARGYQAPSLDFLGAWPLLGLQILDYSVTDLSPIYRLSEHLIDLALTQPVTGPAVDLTQLPELAGLVADWHHVRGSIVQAPQLKSVWIGHYGAPTLQELASAEGLTSIQLVTARQLESLAGIEGLHSLSTFAVYGAPRLTGLSALRGLHRTLREVSIESCKGVKSLDWARDLTALETLGVKNCGDIASLKPLTEHPRLERLLAWESTRVMDGDLHPLETIPHLRKVALQPRRRYSPRTDDLALMGAE